MLGLAELYEDIVKSDEGVENNNKSNIPIDKKNNKNKSKKVIVIVIISIVLVLCIALILLFALPSKTDKKTSTAKNNTLSKSEEKDIIEGYGDALKGIIGLLLSNIIMFWKRN